MRITAFTQRPLAITALCLLMTNIGCITPDKSTTRATLQQDHLVWNSTPTAAYTSEDMDIILYLCKANDTTIKRLLYSVKVDGVESGRHYLTQHFNFGMIEITNKRPYPTTLDLSRISIRQSRNDLSPIPPADLPNRIKRINPKAITKNVHNSICFTSLIILSIGLKGSGEIILAPIGADVLPVFCTNR
jgi:hypothetical protein